MGRDKAASETDPQHQNLAELDQKKNNLPHRFFLNFWDLCEVLLLVLIENA